MTHCGLRSIAFDAGETLIDETRAWAEWADWLEIPRFTFMALLGAVISRGEHHRRAFELARPGFDLREALEERARAGKPHRYLAKDLYPDVRPCLAALKADGYLIGIAGNFDAEAAGFLRKLGLPVDFAGSSEAWGAEKPSAEFFRALTEQAGLAPEEIAYVGDRIDNDIAGAADAGMAAIHIRRGPWAILQAEHPEVSRADLRVQSLKELPAALKGWERKAPWK